MEAEVRELRSIGCKCSQNHYLGISQAPLCDLIVSIRQVSKHDLKQYVLGQLARSVLPPSAAAERRTFCYAILGISVCSKAFHTDHNIGDFVMHALQKLASDGIPAVLEHGSKRKSPSCAVQLNYFIHS